MALVILNPGHFNPDDPGAVGNGIMEADVNVKICDLITAKAPSYGFDIVTVHDNDLDNICAKANTYPDANLFLSIHVNSAVDTEATGFESYIYPGSQKADNIRFYIHIEVANFYRQYGFVDRGKKNANFEVLRETSMPAMLFENLFISDPRDANKLKDDTFLDALAAAYTKGLARALGCAYKGEAEVNVPIWAKEGVMWAVSHGLINDQIGDETFYRFVKVLHDYDKWRFGGG